jgi:hypothetical protein
VAVVLDQDMPGGDPTTTQPLTPSRQDLAMSLEGTLELSLLSVSQFPMSQHFAAEEVDIF